jgi:glycosyltransferase involved in cell wall biosynthesis
VSRSTFPASAPVVAHISEAYGGGIQTVVHNYVVATPLVQHELFIRTRAGQSTFDSPNGSRVTSYSGNLGGFLKAAMRWIWDLRPDVVHLHSSFAGLLRVAPLPRGTIVLYQPHCFGFERRDLGLMARTTLYISEKILTLPAHGFVAVSPHEVATMARLNRRRPAYLIPNATHVVSHRRVSQDSGSVAAQRTVVMMGRILSQKSPEIFAGVAESLRGQGFRFVWIGDGDSELRSTLEKAGVELPGWVHPDIALEIVADADLYFHCAAWEGAPMTAMEAAAVGTPVLSMDIASMRSLGYPIAGSDIASATKAIVEFFADPEVSEATALATAAVVEEQSVEEMTRRLRTLYAVPIV